MNPWSGDAEPRLTLETPDGAIVPGTELDHAMHDYARTAMRTRTLDPVIAELVRLRCAQVHDCRLCGSLRSFDALERGLPDEVFGAIGERRALELDAAAVAALDLCDAIVLSPRAVGERLRDELCRHFSLQQIAEICCAVMKWSHQKALVAVRLEKPRWDEISVLRFDDAGTHRIGEPVSDLR